jgi:transposase
LKIQLPSRNDIESSYNQGIDAVVCLVEGLVKTINELVDTNQKLNDQISKNSGNSSLPPSSDGLKKKPRTRSLREKGQKPNGGQKGHEGHRLEPVEKPDHVIVHEVGCCENCKASLHDIDAIDYTKRQVFDIPPVRIEVTEHQGEIKKCSQCGCTSQAVFPENVTQPTQYGTNLKSHAVYFNTQHHIPFERTADIFEDVFDHRISEGTLIQSINDCAGAVQPVNEVTKNLLINSDVVGFDESGLKVKGKIKWLHVNSTPTLTYYEIHEKRGVDAMNDIGILPNFSGIAVHDHWKPYLKFQTSDHSLCNAHHLRELIFVADQYEQQWANDMIDLLVEINDAIKEVPPTVNFLHPGLVKDFDKRYDQILNNGFEINPAPEKIPGKKGRVKQTPPKNLLDRLRDYKDETLRFMYNLRVPFDNNQSERDIRMIKVKLKVSGTFRTDAGADAFCAIRGYISTAKKNGINIIDAIKGVFNGTPFIPSFAS